MKIITTTARSAFGSGKAAVIEYWDDNRVSAVHVLSVQDQPDQGVASYSTVGLSEYDIGLTVGNKALRLEFVGACASEAEVFANMLATCAFNIINSQFKCSLGAVFPDVVSMYLPDSPLAHILFVSPFLWGDGLPLTVDLADRKVAWLQAVPISEAERRYAVEHGADALETLFEEYQIDVYDLHRSSVVP